MVNAIDPRSIRFTRPRDDLPWELLLDADPSRRQVESYLSDGLTRIAWHGDDVVGVYVLAIREPTRFELMNIAVDATHRGKGIGRWVIGHALGLAESKGARIVDVGTANSSIDNLVFYQRCGFRIVGVDPDYFTDNYDEPIHENGVQARDRIRLRLHLTPE